MNDIIKVQNQKKVLFILFFCQYQNFIRDEFIIDLIRFITDSGR